MAAAVANESCDPFTSRELPCELGPSVTYSVNATNASDFVKAAAFTGAKKIRLVIRGHKPAIRLGAGIQVKEAYVAARAVNSLVVGGDCDTIGVAGGYLQGLYLFRSCSLIIPVPYVIVIRAWSKGVDLGAMEKLAKTMTHTRVPALTKLAPDSGAYLNERKADSNQTNWQTALYGANYDRLLATKNKYDPRYVFHATTAVSSEYYTIDDAARLCFALNRILISAFGCLRSMKS
ncbi:hypothetical protein HD806DRAFT_541259 [Xylariaceae sp. AK1471]|nr:hypothetical protein HD806DRAFT_541259 [Xylariaceae sp. AK1471]